MDLASLIDALNAGGSLAMLAILVLLWRLDRRLLVMELQVLDMANKLRCDNRARDTSPLNTHPPEYPDHTNHTQEAIRR